MRRIVVPMIAAVAAAAGLVAVDASGQSSSPTATTEHFLARFLGGTSGSFNHLRPGRSFTAHSAIYDASGKHRLGHDSELCTETLAKPLTMQCFYTVILRGGNFTAQNAFNPTTARYKQALVGGTGRFAGAHGELLSVPAKGRAEAWTITYTRS